MSVEKELKELILKRYGTMKDFVPHTGLPYSTVDSILRRGLNQASIDNVIIICKTLRISVDELAEGRIVPISPPKSLEEKTIKLDDILPYMQNVTREFFDITESEADTIIEAVEFAVRLIKKNRGIIS